MEPLVAEEPNVTPSTAARAAAASAAGSRPSRSGARSRNGVASAVTYPQPAWHHPTVLGDVEDARHGAGRGDRPRVRRALGALRVVLLVDGGDGGTDDDRLRADGALELTEDEDRATVPADTPVERRAAAAARPAPAAADRARDRSRDRRDSRRRWARSPTSAGGVLALARAFGGRSVATADFATRDPELPVTIAAREGEPLVLAAGDHRFVLPDLVR